RLSLRLRDWGRKVQLRCEEVRRHLGLTFSSSAWRISWRKRLPILRAGRGGHPSDEARGRSFAAVSPQRLSAMNDVTRILSAIEHGDPLAAEQLLPLVYDELRKLAAAKLAHEKPGQTLQATALVHEAYLRLVGGKKTQRWDSRGHFFAAAAEAMRRILLNRARDRNRLKRGGGGRKIDLDQIEVALDTPDEDLL